MAIHVEEDFCDFRAFCEKKPTARSSNICVIRDICARKEKPAGPSLTFKP